MIAIGEASRRAASRAVAVSRGGSIDAVGSVVALRLGIIRRG